jgi:hypothetical protein
MHCPQPRSSIRSFRVRRLSDLALPALLAVLSFGPTAARAAVPSFRTDDGGNDKLPWFQLRPGEFPPDGSAHHLAGELIAVDHVNRTGVLRPDRTDAQRRGDWDLPLPFVLLPYGSVSYHGAPADLRDVPIGTHLHGQFYVDEPAPKVAKAGKAAKPESGARLSVDAAFSRVLRLEDDFSHFARTGRAWRVDAVQPDAGTLIVTAVGSVTEIRITTGTGAATSPAGAKPTTFQVGPYTRVWKGRGVGTLSDVTPGQTVLLSLTACTLKGPGRCSAVWVDDESRAVATTHQIEVHRQHQREHGLAGWVDEVDNQQGTVTVTLFAGFDPKLKDDFAVDDVVTAAVAEDSLRTWDQINDRKVGPALEISSGPVVPGSSGVRVKFKPALLLEGFRPKRVVRLWPSKWKVDDLPREERLYQ